MILTGDTTTREDKSLNPVVNSKGFRAATAARRQELEGRT